MDTDDFFGFDASLGPDNGSLDGNEPGDEDYDALNDETFGSAMVDGDWEEGHQHMANITEAGRNNSRLHREGDLVGIEDDLLGLGLGRHGPLRGSSTQPIAIHHSFGLGAGDLPGSPANASIWTPSPVLDKIIPALPQSPSSGAPMPQLLPPRVAPHSHNTPFPPVKTVKELEEEIKLQQQSHNLMNTVLRAEDLERELSLRQKNQILNPLQPPHHHVNSQGINNSHGMGNNQYHQFPRQGSFSGMPSHPMNHMNRHMYPPPPHAVRSDMGPMGSPNMPPHQRFIMPQQYKQNQFNNHHPPYGNHPHGPHMNHFQRGHNQMNNFNRNVNGRPNDGYWRDQRPSNGYDRRNGDRRPFDHNRIDNGYERRENDYHNNHGGNRVRRDSEAEWEEWARLREIDEYSGLMTPSEKSWLKNIQTMQLKSDNPYQSDYYYLMHSVKQQRKRPQDVIEINGLSLLALLPDRSQEKEYEPPRLENSLGKLQVVSVNAPRKIIDLEVVHPEPGTPSTDLQKEMRRHRHLLLFVERLYNSLMALDDMQRKIQLMNDCPTRDKFRRDVIALGAQVWRDITSVEGRLEQALCIRKGKQLLQRLGPFLSAEPCHAITATILGNLAAVVKRDIHDQMLSGFWPLVEAALLRVNAQGLLLYAQAIEAKKDNIIAALNTKFGVSICVCLLLRGEVEHEFLMASGDWSNFLLSIVTALSQVPAGSNTAASDKVKSSVSEPLAMLPLVVMANPMHRPSQHLARCLEADAAAVAAASEKLDALFKPNDAEANLSQ